MLGRQVPEFVHAAHPPARLLPVYSNSTVHCVLYGIAACDGLHGRCMLGVPRCKFGRCMLRVPRCKLCLPELGVRVVCVDSCR